MRWYLIMFGRMLKHILGIIAPMCTVACVSGLGESPVETKARISNWSSSVQQDVKRALAEHLGKADIKFGGVNVDNVHIIPVLPTGLSVYDGMSFSKPELFYVFLENDICILRNELHDTRIELPKTKCLPA